MSDHTCDIGLFGPRSASWTILREAPVMIGGLRALLMQAVHPLVIAGVDSSRSYESEPWRRLERTLGLYLQMTFGTTADAHSAARTINDRHRKVGGVDLVTGTPYHARDSDLLLWVHSCLILGFLDLERMTVGSLDESGRQRFHDEQKRVAALLGLRPKDVPRTVQGLADHVAEVIGSGILRTTQGSATVGRLVRRPPADVPYGRAIRVAQTLAFAALPAEVRALYDIPHPNAGRVVAPHLANALRQMWPRMTPRLRYIAPYRLALARTEGITNVPSGGLFWDVDQHVASGRSRKDRDDCR